MVIARASAGRFLGRERGAVVAVACGSTLTWGGACRGRVRRCHATGSSGAKGSSEGHRSRPRAHGKGGPRGEAE